MMLKAREVTRDYEGEWTYDYNGEYVCYLCVSMWDKMAEYVGYGSKTDIALNRAKDMAIVINGVIKMIKSMIINSDNMYNWDKENNGLYACEIRAYFSKDSAVAIGFGSSKMISKERALALIIREYNKTLIGAAFDIYRWSEDRGRYILLCSIGD